MSSKATTSMSVPSRRPCSRIGGQGTEGHQVVGSEDGGRAIRSGQQLLGRPNPAHCLEVAEFDQCRIDVQTSPRKRLDEGVIALPPVEID